MQTGTYTKEIGEMTKPTGRVYLLTLTMQGMKEIGLTILSMATVKKRGTTVPQDIKVNFSKVKRMVMVVLTGKMEVIMKVSL